MAWFQGTAGHDSIVGTGDGDVFAGSLGNDTLNGGGVGVFAGGINKAQDLVDYDALPVAVLVDLRAGRTAKANGDADVLVGFDQAWGGAGADTLTGNDDRNWFSGRAGNDSIDGGGPSPSDNGDRVLYELDPAGVQVDLAAGVATDGWGGTDRIANIEYVHGSMFDDVIRGDDAANGFRGLAGNDTIDGGGGFDEVDFREGQQAPTTGVVVDLAAGVVHNDGFGGRDVLIGIEAVQGSPFADHVTGDGADNVFIGVAGADTLDGGAGAGDMASYYRDPAAVSVSLAAGHADDGWGQRDTLLSIENIYGSPFDDTLEGDGGVNQIRGASGNDQIVGGGGADTLHGDEQAFGEAGDDTLFGNTGDDRVFGNGGRDVIFGGQGSDTLFGGQGADLVYGNMLDDLMYGNLGDDTLHGGQGADTIYGGQGADLINGNLGDDVLYGNGGADAFQFHTLGGTDTVADFNADDGDRIALAAGTAYTVATAADGSVLLRLEDGAGLTLIGIAPAEFSAAWVVAA